MVGWTFPLLLLAGTAQAQQGSVPVVIYQGDDPGLAAAGLDPAVVAGHPRAGHADVIVQGPPDGDHGLIKVELAAEALFFDDGQLQD